MGNFFVTLRVEVKSDALARIRNPGQLRQRIDYYEQMCDLGLLKNNPHISPLSYSQDFVVTLEQGRHKEMYNMIAYLNSSHSFTPDFFLQVPVDVITNNGVLLLVDPETNQQYRMRQSKNKLFPSVWNNIITLGTGKLPQRFILYETDTPHEQLVYNFKSTIAEKLAEKINANSQKLKKAA